MPNCHKCNESFPNWTTVNGEKKNHSSRKYCFKCSPIGRHNTKNLHEDKPPIKYKCSKCGETDPNKFYGRKRCTCGKCHNEYTIQKGRENKEKALKYLGGRCVICGFDTYSCSLEFHHTDPSEKDKNFEHLRNWSWDRIIVELDKCKILCSNCHHAVHAGLLNIDTMDT